MSSGRPAFSIEGDSISLRLDAAAYSLGTVHATGYRLARRATLVVESADAQGIVARLLLRGSVTVSDAQDIVALFFRELADQELRAQLRAETSDLRALILAHAFSKTDLVARE
jgi:His-Xaa-Ser system protein HxsD